MTQFIAIAVGGLLFIGIAIIGLVFSWREIRKQ